MVQSDYLCSVINITEHIEHLILRHDCVVIPGIGALIAHYIPAYIDTELECIFPPKRKLTFNPSINHNDGLLAMSVARKERVAYESALEIVNEQVKEIQNYIHNQGEVEIGRLGILSLNNDDKSSYLFNPFDTTNVAPSFAGLTAIGVKPLPKVSKTLATKNETRQKDTYYVSRHLLHAVASIMVFLMLGLTLSTPIIDHNLNKASIGISITDGNADVWEPRFDSNPRISLDIAMPDPATSSACIEPSVKAESEECRETAHLDEADEYFLIVASLPSMEKASEYIREHSGSDSMSVLEADGRFRVYVASGATYSEANAYNKSGRYPNAWVCKR